jgi:hypothetical protein
MRAVTERRYPLIAGLAAGIAFFFLAPSFPVAADAAPSLFSAVISVAAIAVGFLATAKSILLSIENKPIIADLKAHGRYSTLIDYLMCATKWSFFLAVMSITCFLADLKTPYWHRWLFAFWVFAMFSTGASCFRVIHIFGKILRT